MAAATALFPAAVGPAATAACLALVGLSETITALQFFCKMTYAADPVRLRSNLLRLVSGNIGRVAGEQGVAGMLQLRQEHTHLA